MSIPLISIITPTYNRGKFLNRVYQSLKGQNNNNFEWIIIDDGSVDNTQEIIQQFDNAANNFQIHSLLQENGGKHRAINHGIKMAQGKWVLILDSDDWLTSTAIEEMTQLIEGIAPDNSFCSITALRVTPDLMTIGTECTYESWDTTFFDYRFKYRIKGDRAEIVRTDILKEYPFPEFQNENFLAEGILWNNLSERFKTRFVSNKFYICEYQEGGLTDTFEKKMESNPLGSMANQLSVLTHTNCPLKYYMLSNYLYYKYKKIAIKQNISIPKELGDNIRMKITSILNPLISFAFILKNLGRSASGTWKPLSS